jgi:GNAT superfamily N-acetyltransferase
VRGGFVLIRRLSTQDSFEDLTDLLHRAYAPLAAAGMHFLATHQSAKTTQHRCESGDCFVIEHEERVVATITVYHDRADSDCLLYRDPGVWYFGQFAVEPHLQRNGIGESLLKHAEEFARSMGATHFGCDTSEQSARLIAYYTRLGFSPVGFQQWPEVNYRSVVLMKKI